MDGMVGLPSHTGAIVPTQLKLYKDDRFIRGIMSNFPVNNLNTSQPQEN